MTRTLLHAAMAAEGVGSGLVWLMFGPVAGGLSFAFSLSAWSLGYLHATLDRPDGAWESWAGEALAMAADEVPADVVERVAAVVTTPAPPRAEPVDAAAARRLRYGAVVTIGRRLQ